MTESKIFKRLKSGEFRGQKKSVSSLTTGGGDDEELDATAAIIEDDESRRKREETEDTTPYIELAIRYDYKKNEFLVYLDRCKHLALPEEEAGAAEEKEEVPEEGFANSGAEKIVDLNPRVKFRLLPNTSNDTRRQSSVKKNTSEPQWRKYFRWSLPKSLVELYNLWVTVWDVRLFHAPRLIGEKLVPLRYQPFNDTKARRFTLSLPYRKMEVPLAITPYRGELTLAIKFEPSGALVAGTGTGTAPVSVSPEAPETQTAMQLRANRSHKNSASQHRQSVFQRTGNLGADVEGDLHVHIRGARNLLSADGNPCSAYCRVALRPMRSGKGERTPTIENKNDPEWDHEVHFRNVTIEALQKQCLQVSVYNKGRLGTLWRRKLLGGMRLNLGPVQYSQEFRTEFFVGEQPLQLPRWMDARGDEVLAWLAMLQRPNTWVVATLLLHPLLAVTESAAEGLLRQTLVGAAPAVQ